MKYIMQKCPCGTGKPYVDCCGVFISHQQYPATPEELMRSRYTAYSLANMDYILETMKPPAATGFDAKSTRKWAKKIKWTGLKIVSTQQNAIHGTVEFIACYDDAKKKKHILHEISEFHFENGRWVYFDGKFLN